MVYVLKQKFNIADLAEVSPARARVLLVLEEQLLGEIYRRHFFSHGFEAELAHERDLLRLKAAIFKMGEAGFPAYFRNYRGTHPGRQHNEPHYGRRSGRACGQEIQPANGYN